MTFNKATAIIKKLSHSAFGWFFTVKNTSRKAVAVDQGNPAGGMFGQLVSKDTTHRK